MSKINSIKKLVENNNGYLITSKVLEIGVSKPTITRFVKSHNMEKVAHGIYVFDDIWPDELFILQERNKSIIFSGETALYLHGLIDREYKTVCFSVPIGYNASHIKVINKEVHYASPEIINLGVCKVKSISGNMIRAYDKERCICDTVKNRKKYEVQLFQTAIKEYMSSKDKNLTNLTLYSEKLGVRDEVMKYVEVLV